MFVSKGLGRALCRPENAKLLTEWAGAILSAVTIPVIFKIGLTDPVETLAAVDKLADVGIPVVHINLGETRSGSRGLLYLEQLVGRCQCLIAGGGIRNVDDARRVLDAGANAVAIGTAAMKDPGLCGSIQRALRQREAGQERLHPSCLFGPEWQMKIRRRAL